MFPINSRFREHYKKNGVFCADAGKYKRAQRKIEERRASRTEHFSRQRNLIALIDDSETRKTTVDARKLKLQKWKEEKEKLQKWKEEKQMHKMLKKASEKPVFKCGIVHHKVGSPYLNDISNTNYTGHAKKMSSTPAKREGQKVTHKSCTLKKNLVTDNKEQSFAPPNFKFKPPEIRPAALIAEGPRSNISDTNKGVLSTKSNNNPLQEKSLRRVTRSQTRACNQPVQYNFSGVQKRADKPIHKNVCIPKSRDVPKTEAQGIDNSNSETVKGAVALKQDAQVIRHLNSEDSAGPSDREIAEEPHTSESHVKCETVSTPVTMQCFPFQYSPFVTMHRGSSGRRSRSLKDVSKQNLQNVNIVNDSSPLGTSASSSHALDQAYNNQHHGVLYFRTVLDNAVSRLEDMCQEWLHIQSSVPDVPLETSDLISAAVGQTQLLLRSKFSQFRDLINKCEKSLEGETKEPVTCSDLEGFWDMVFIQVEDVDIRFNKLQKLKLNNWTEETEAVIVKPKQPLTRGAKKSKKFQKTAQSSLRAMIIAARKRKQQVETSETMGGISINPACTPEQAGVTRRMSTRQSQTPQLQHTLLQQNRRHSQRLSRELSPFIEKMTHMFEGINTSVPKVQFSEVAESSRSRRIPLPNQTPRKSILKPALFSPLKPTKTPLNNDAVTVNESRRLTRQSVRLFIQAQD